MSALVSQATVELEYQEASEYGASYGWEFSPLDAEKQLFTVQLVSSVDQERYWFEFRYDDYPEKPYLIEPFYPPTGERGTLVCFPKGPDTFFHPSGFICHPCSRRAYANHGEWAMSNWRLLAGGMNKLRYILDTFYHRINNQPYYHGRMAKHAAR